MVPDAVMLQISQLKFFQYSTIYSYCLQLLIDGKFAWNLGHSRLGLDQWASLVPIGLVILGTTAIFARMKPEQEGKPTPS